MSPINIIILILLSVATIFTIENWSQPLSLIFLGTSTIPLPLSLWVLLSVAAGAVTSWFLATLSPSSHYPSTRSPRPQSGESRRTVVPPPSPTPSYDKIPTRNQDWFDQPAAPIPPDREDEPWEDESENWVDEGEDQAEPQSPIIYEIPQKPNSESWSGSVYSYTYQPTPEPEPEPEPEPKPEPEPPATTNQKPPVQDARYRVIVTPSSSGSSPVKPSSKPPDDDWEKPTNPSDDW